MAKKTKVDNTFRITQLNNSDSELTGSMMLLEVDNLRILLDCGLIQNDLMPFERLYNLNKERGDIIEAHNLDYAIGSHSNFDHISALPFLSQEGRDFNGKIIMTELASELTAHILRDGAKIHESDVKRHNGNTGKSLKPFYTMDDAENVIQMIQGYSYDEKIRLSDNVYLELLPSGHIAGSALIYITHEDEYGKCKHFMYCPDMYYGDVPRPFTKSIVRKCYKASMVVLEGTYAGKPNHSKELPIDVLEQAILDTCLNNEILWVPCFSLQRSTQLCYLLDEIFKRNEEIRNKNIPVFNVGKLTKLCHDSIGKLKYMEFYDDEWNNSRDIFDNPRFEKIVEKKGVEHFILNNQVKIVLSSSGAITNGFSSLIGESFIGNKKVNILSCGYIFPESTLDKIARGDRKVLHNGTLRTRRCKFIRVLPNLSGHVDMENNIKWIKSFNQKVLKKVIISHCTNESGNILKEVLHKELPNVDVIFPKFKEVVKC